MKAITRRTLCILLFAAMLTASSCGGTTTDPSLPTDSPAAEETAAQETEDSGPTVYEANVPADSSFGGYDFTFLVRGNEHGDWGNYDICVEELTGDVVNDAIFNRNLAVAAAYDVNIVDLRMQDVLGTAKSGIASQDNSFDAIISSFWDAATLAAEGSLYNLKDVNYIDLDQPWWDQNANADLSIAHKLPFSVNDISILAAEATIDVYLFNKTMLKDFSLDNPYDLVKEGTWTYDVMMEMMTGVASDLNGDGVMDENDRWGMANNSGGVINSVFKGAAQNYVQKDDKDIPYLAINNERAMGAMELMVKLMYENPDTLDNAQVMDTVFTSGRSLFHDQCLQCVKRFRQMDTDFGILPNPKYDETMDGYRHGVHPIGGAYSIPITITGESLDRTAIVTEVLAAESKNTLIPAYYDVNLTHKLLRDEESQATLEIILNTRDYDLIHPYNWGGLTGAFNALAAEGEANFASTYEMYEEATNQAIQKTLDKFLGD